ncbi:hypothetical protein Riv7116_3078 [Rivularia sp. PCC 7116]|nr:hypothetical protein Riv7116_3078 [Rivularia sp. PCC 7116]
MCITLLSRGVIYFLFALELFINIFINMSSKTLRPLRLLCLPLRSKIYNSDTLQSPLFHLFKGVVYADNRTNRQLTQFPISTQQR